MVFCETTIEIEVYIYLIRSCLIVSLNYVCCCFYFISANFILYLFRLLLIFLIVFIYSFTYNLP